MTNLIQLLASMDGEAATSAEMCDLLSTRGLRGDRGHGTR